MEEADNIDPQVAGIVVRVDRLENEVANDKEEHKKFEKSDDCIWEFMRDLKEEFATYQRSQLEINVKESDFATGQQAMRSEISEATLGGIATIIGYIYK